MPWIALLRQFWKPLACAAVLLLAWWALHHYGATRFSAGYQQAVSENAKALADWQLKYDAQVKADEDRINKAHHQHELEIAQLAVARAKPVSRVVCRAAPRDPGNVPATAGLSEAGAARSGSLSGPPQPGPEPASFDPTDKLIELADEADDMLAACRMLHQAVHGIPSTLASRIPPNTGVPD